MIRRELETYDKARDERILASKDIVKAYHEAINLQFDKARKLVDSHNKDVANGVAMPGAFNNRGNELGNLVRLISSMDEKLQKLKDDYDLTDDDCKRVIIENAYCMTDDPNQIRDIINTRIQYNNTMIAILKNMVQENYAALGMMDFYAKIVLEQLNSNDPEEQRRGIANAKQIDYEKFRKNDHYDFRSIGGGVLFFTKESLGAIAVDNMRDRLLQYAFEYDAVVIAHGFNGTKSIGGALKLTKANKEINKIAEDTNDKLAKLIQTERKLTNNTNAMLNNMQVAVRANDQLTDEKRIKTITANVSSMKKQLNDMKVAAKQAAENNDDKTVSEINDKLNKIQPIIDRHLKELDELTEKINKASKDDSVEAQIIQVYKEAISIQKKQVADQNKITDELAAYLKKHKNSSFWSVQPTYTLNGGPFNDMDKLVRQLIKEGFKNIYIISCNPGNHELAKDILNTPGVKIRHSVNTTFSENVDDSSFDKAMNILDETEYELNVLSETYKFNEYESVFVTNNYISLNEGTISKMWNTLVEWIKKIIGAVINFFKKVINAFRNAIEKIKSFFEKRKNKGKFIKKIKVGIVTENKVEETEIGSYDQLKNDIVIACEKLTNTIKKYEQESIKGMQEAEKYADQQSKKAVNESIEDFDVLVDMLW